jgi:hypothetical protein
MRNNNGKFISIDVAACIRAFALLIFVLLSAPATLLFLRWIIGLP